MQRDTRQRREILQALKIADHPLSPQEILQRVDRSGGSVNISTVYRNLSAMVSRGNLVEVKLPGESSRYELSGKGHHHHFCCRKCKRVLEIEHCVADVGSIVPPGCIVEDHDLFLYGLCAECAARRRRKK